MVEIRATRSSSLLRGVLIGLALVAATAPQARAFVALPAQPSQPRAQVDVASDVSRLESALAGEVPNLIVDQPQAAQEWIARASTMVAATGMTIDRPQLLVVVDRNPRVQQMRLVLAQPHGQWEDLGGTKVSTGRPVGYEHFLTPTGVFLHTDRIVDWRAEGTFNEASASKGCGSGISVGSAQSRGGRAEPKSAKCGS
jgi:hypothetical protein